MDFTQIGLQLPEILLPAQGVDPVKWAVIACDQYTSQPDYWRKLAETVGDAPSTLKITFPEVYLEQPDETERIEAINTEMHRYLDQGVLQPQAPGFVLVDRKTAHAPSRKGLMVALDLQRYDYSTGSTSLIRATEGTILDRLPPRIRVRENACLETPHIMVLIDDPERTVIEPLFDQDLPQLYDFELLANGGHLKGWQVTDPALLQQVGTKLAALADPESFREKYRLEQTQAPLLFAMGDGNHSFATAKAIWEKLKEDASDPAEVMDHPARWALVELVNLHDPGLEFEAIHRVVFGAELDHLAEAMQRFVSERGCGFNLAELANETAVEQVLSEPVDESTHRIPVVAGSRFALLEVTSPQFNLTVATLQQFLDDYLATTKARIDYIHGSDVVTELGGKQGNIGFYLPAISKFELFRTIILDGALPRKTFSMGEADEKRFYLECRRIAR
ncbi:MAG: DUF1015 domain-containing protein [Desulfuromonas sp.]|nr:MAG: DUF1015 domain-containing protein [Desulfuromonas sp.]